MVTGEGQPKNPVLNFWLPNCSWKTMLPIWISWLALWQFCFMVILLNLFWIQLYLTKLECFQISLNWLFLIHQSRKNLRLPFSLTNHEKFGNSLRPQTVEGDSWPTLTPVLYLSEGLTFVKYRLSVYMKLIVEYYDSSNINSGHQNLIRGMRRVKYTLHSSRIPNASIIAIPLEWRFLFSLFSKFNLTCQIATLSIWFSTLIVP